MPIDGAVGWSQSQGAFDFAYTNLRLALARDARALANGNGVYVNSNGEAHPYLNAIEHTYTSAHWAYYLPRSMETSLGDLKEWLPSLYYGPDERDTFRDQWNNEVGRRIAEWAYQHQLPIEAIDRLVMDALQHGDLITDVNDPRIPPPGRIVGPQGEMTFHPGDPNPTWNGPNVWDPSTWSIPGVDPFLPRDYTGIPDPFGDLGDWIADKFAALADRLSHMFHDGLEHASQFVSDIFGRAFARPDPLVMDLGGDGVHLVSLDSSNVHFDLDSDGFAEAVGWVTAGDGLLALDLNHNGSIDNGSELIGNGLVDGFSILATFDTNNDGVINSSDAVFSDLRVWQDLNQDGISQTAELSSLSSRGVISMAISAVPQDFWVQRDGNSVLFSGGYSSTGGQREVIAVGFASDRINTQFILPEGFEFDPEVFGLPNLRGFGSVPDLWVAMSLDPTLKDMVKQLVADAATFTSIDDLVGATFSFFTAAGQPPAWGYAMEDFDRLLARWAGVDAGDEERIQVENVAESFMNRQAVQAFNNPIFYDAFEKFATEFALKFYVQVPAGAAIAGLFDLAIAIHDAVPADGVTLSSSEIEAIVAAVGSDVQLPSEISESLVHFGLLTYDFASDRLVGDVDGFIDAELAGYEFDADDPWSGYQSWYDSHSMILKMVDPDGSHLQDRHRVYTGNVDLAILRSVHDTLSGTSAAETLVGDDGGFSVRTDLLIGGAGNDLLQGGLGNDTYLFRDGSGSDIVSDTSGSDEIAFQGALTGAIVRFAFADVDHRDLRITFDGRDETVTVMGYFTADGAATIESMTFPDGLVSQREVRDGVYSTLATAGNDTIKTGPFGTTLVGLAGNDHLVGRFGDDTLAGGLGNDLLTGSGGNDTYRFELNGGSDVVRDTDDIWDGWGGDDTIEFGDGIGPWDLAVSEINGGNDLLITVGGANGTITIVGTVNDGDQRIERIVFADGTVWTHSDLMRLALSPTASNDTFLGSYDGERIDGGTGNDVVDARGGNDLLIGGLGDDLLSGSGGNDIYQFGLGDGHDIVRDDVSVWSGRGGFDVVDFTAGISPGDVSVTQVNSNDLVLTITGTGDSITLDETVNDGYQRIEQVRFSDGTTWSFAELLDMALAPTSGNDTFYGSYDAETIEGAGGNDIIDARAGNDILIGGTGNDLLSGSGGDDTYVFAVGDGHDIVRDSVDVWSGRGGFDTIQFASGIAPGDVLVSQADNGRDLVLAIA
ncbi:MAG TPA: calcium-binding protein, partial [Allosphingosinicella sp.]